MACAVSTLTATPRDDTCAEIGAVEKVAAANSRPMSDPVLIASLCLAPTEWAPPIKRTALTARAIQHTLGVWIEPLSHNAAKQKRRAIGRAASERSKSGRDLCQHVPDFHPQCDKSNAGGRHQQDPNRAFDQSHGHWENAPRTFLCPRGPPVLPITRLAPRDKLLMVGSRKVSARVTPFLTLLLRMAVGRWASVD